MSVDSGALADWPVEPDVASPPPPNSMDACRALESTGMVTTRNKETDLFSDAQVGYLDMLPVKWGDTGTAILRGFRLIRGGSPVNKFKFTYTERDTCEPNGVSTKNMMTAWTKCSDYGSTTSGAGPWVCFRHVAEPRAKEQDGGCTRLERALLSFWLAAI